MPLPYKLNLDDVPWEAYEQGRFSSEDKYISAGLRRRHLDATLTRLAPGKVSTPYHCHHVGEELFLILEGAGTLRYDGQTVPVRAGDVISCPPGPDSAHQFLNTGDAPLIYWAISTENEVDVCEYPDSDKLLASVAQGDRRASRVFRRADQVDYWEGEAGSQ